MVRFKNRYLLVELAFKDGKIDETITEQIILGDIRQSLQQNFGDHALGSALVSLFVKHYNPVTGLCIIRCSRDQYRQVWFCLTMLTEMRHRVVAIRMVRLSGSFSACKSIAKECNVALMKEKKLSQKYIEELPVIIKADGRKPQVQSLSVRLIEGPSKKNLRLFVYEEADPRVLFSLDISEKGFQNIREEESLLVDYSSFPKKLVDLLKKCSSNNNAEILDASTPTTTASHAPPLVVAKFRAELYCMPGSTGQFRILESNDFKDLSHLTLNLKEGTHNELNQFLAFRLEETKSQCTALAVDLDTTQNKIASLTTTLSKTREEAIQDKEERENKCKGLEVRLLNSEEKRSLVEGQVAGLTRQLEDSRKLQSELKSQSESYKESSHNFTVQLTSTQKSLKESQSQVKVLETALETQKSIAKEQTGRVQMLEETLEQVEKDGEELSSALSAYEARTKEAIAEVVKANETIDTMTLELDKSGEQIRQQKGIIAGLERQICGDNKQISSLKAENALIKDEFSSLSSSGDETKAEVLSLREEIKAKDAKLAANNQMIRWLNGQITDAHLGRLRLHPGSSSGGSSGGGGGGGGGGRIRVGGGNTASIAGTTTPQVHGGWPLPSPAAVVREGVHVQQRTVMMTPAGASQTAATAAAAAASSSSLPHHHPNGGVERFGSAKAAALAAERMVNELGHLGRVR